MQFRKYMVSANGKTQVRYCALDKSEVDSRLAFNMCPSLLKSVCILINNSILPCTIDYTTFAVSGKVERSDKVDCFSIIIICPKFETVQENDG